MSEDAVDVEEYRRLFGVDPPFLGEEMRCHFCPRVERSDPRTKSEWWAIDLRGDEGELFRVYVCPDCARLGPGGIPTPSWERRAA